MTAEILVIALTILGEARGEGFEGMAGVASVIQTRTIERKQTAMQVCLAPKQFSFWNGGVSETKKQELLNNPQVHNAIRLAKLVVEKRMPDVVNGANHYHTFQVSPSWSRGKETVAIIRNHKFYRL
ncbi:cell wall hydrolase [bacterium]|nr:cell wall hydrolase [Candidatus Elulimicrobium humile]